MKVLVELNNNDIDKYKDHIDGIVLGLKDFSVFNHISYTKEEIKEISDKYDFEVFVKIDKNIFNDEIEELSNCLVYLNELNIKGVFFYDLALLEIKRQLDLDIDLIWSQTHMVTNYRTVIII